MSGTLLDRIKEVELELSRTQRNKATERSIGVLRAKLAKLRSELLDPSGPGSGPGEGFEVNRTGHARIALIGFPSVGKSTLLTTLTGTESLQAAYEFTTLTCVPGNVFYKNTKLQVLDLPGIIEGASQGRGRGRQVIAVAKSSDLVLMVLDASKEVDGQSNHRAILERELETVGLRLNKAPPDVHFKRRSTGGIKVSAVGFPGLTHFGDDPEGAVKAILHEYRVHNADVLFREDATADDLIDVVNGNRKYVRCLYAYNKVDQISVEATDKLVRENYNSVAVSSHAKLGLDWLLERVWQDLALVRVYTKPPQRSPDFSDPVILTKSRHGVTVEGACLQIHRQLVADFSHAFVFGTSVKHQPQAVGLSHVLEDEDVIRIVKKPNSALRRDKNYNSRVQQHWEDIRQRRKKKPLKT